MAPERVSIPYRVHRRAVTYPRLEFRTGTLDVIVPPHVDVEALLRRHRRWILRRYAEIQEARQRAENLPLVDRDRETWLDLLHRYREEAEALYRVRAVRLQVRRMKTKWGSCSRKGTLTLNTLTRLLPDALLRYLVHHEVVHLRIPHHRSAFWRLLSRTVSDAEAHERELAAYWFRLMEVFPDRLLH